MAKQIPLEVLTALSAMEFDGNMARLTGDLDRRLYVATNKVLEAAGGKWHRTAKAHVFPGDAADALEPLILTGEYSKPNTFDFFETPPDVAARVMELADIRPGHHVLEPSAGRGALVAQATARGAAVVHCIEIQQSNALHLAAQFLPKIAVVQCADFLTCELTAGYDRVVMNPPFGGQADIRHVTRAMRFLKSGGTLVSVMSAGITFRQDRLTTEFREFADRHGGMIEALPPGSFRESGTMVNAVIVKMVRA